MVPYQPFSPYGSYTSVASHREGENACDVPICPSHIT
jgi:hypothetical protein